MQAEIAAFSKFGKKIVAVGRNYAAHAKELGNQVPTEPFFFVKPTTSYVCEGNPILLPKNCILHHEVELGVVIGKQARSIKEISSNDYIAGYVLALDMTARNWQDEAKKKKDILGLSQKVQILFAPLVSLSLNHYYLIQIM